MTVAKKLRKAKKNPVDQVFNPLGRKLMRREFPFSELAFGTGFLVFLLMLAIWIRLQKESYNAGDRDLGYEALLSGSREDRLYRMPLRRWVEPGSERWGGAPLELGPFPVALLDDGWAVDGRLEEYDPSNLYEKINGAAEQFLKFGFQRLYYVTLWKGEHLLALELYDQGSFQNALGLFAEQYD